MLILKAENSNMLNSVMMKYANKEQDASYNTDYEKIMKIRMVERTARKYDGKMSQN